MVEIPVDEAIERDEKKGKKIVNIGDEREGGVRVNYEKT